jgi:Glycosyltransferase like family 2
MPEVAFVMSAAQPHALRELAHTLQYELGLQAIPSSLHLGRFPDKRPDRIYVLVDPCGYAAIEGEQALPDDAILKRTIFVCAEPPPAGSSDNHLDVLRRAGAVFALDQRVRIAMHRLGVPARLLRPGYSKSLDHFDHEAVRPIDVMFIGAHSLRRTRYLSRAARVLSRHNCLLHISERSSNREDAGPFLGEDRWSLLAQTKVLINLHSGEDTRTEWGRVLDAVHAGAVVVTEHSSGIAPLIPGEHLLVASPDSLPYVVEAVLRDGQRLAALRAGAYARLSSWIPFALPVSVLRASVVELVGEPVPPDASLGAIRATPAAMDLTGPWPVEARDPVGVPVDATRAEVTHESPAWSATRGPRVTVITALSGERESVVPTLDSLARSRLGDFELVLVGDESSGQVSGDAGDWIATHPHIAARLVVRPDRGVGAARNSALTFARGAFCLTLDPGQELYPRCLDALADTLQRMPHVAFAYPMQEVTGAPDAFVDSGGDYVMSFLDWDPLRLRVGNYIHAPYLIRTDRLRQLSGCVTDPRLAGFEDYDMWCRIAERGWRGQLVPQELARRSESGSSGTLKAMHPTTGPATTALMERAPALMSGAFSAS